MDPILTTSDVINIVLSLITAISTSYLAYAALKHTTRPNATVYLNEPALIYAGDTNSYKFSFKNIGHWYSKPMVVNMTAFINFDEHFDLFFLQYGSAQEVKDDNVRIGKGRMKFLKAKGIKLSYGEDQEEMFVCARSPLNPGRYRIKVSAYSDNGLSLTKQFDIMVLKPYAQDE